MITRKDLKDRVIYVFEAQNRVVGKIDGEVFASRLVPTPNKKHYHWGIQALKNSFNLAELIGATKVEATIGNFDKLQTLNPPSNEYPIRYISKHQSLDYDQDLFK